MTETTRINSGFNWMPVPQVPGIPDCPAGLEFLLQLDRFIVSRYQEVGFSSRRYRVRNSLGQDIYIVRQNFECSCPQTVQMFVTDSYQRQVAQFLSGSTGFCVNPLWEMNAESPPGNYIGGVKQDHAIAFHQWFSVLSSSGETALKITKSTGQWFSPEVDFKILSADGTQEVGVITKQYAGLLKSMFNFEAQHTFGITFPMDLDVRMKAVMVLAAIVIDIYYFEKSK